MNPTGKGAYLYVLRSCEGGDMRAVARKARERGISWLAPRVVGWNQLDARAVPFMQGLREACDAEGIQLGGWGYHIGLTRTLASIARSEAIAADQAIRLWGLDFYVVNCEKEYKAGWSDLIRGWLKRPASKLRAAMLEFWSELRSRQPQISIGGTSYRYPNSHPGFVWDEFRDPRWCNFDQPQVYALGDLRAQGPAIQLAESRRQYLALGASPMVPIMALYPYGAWSMTRAQILAFGEAAKDLPGYGGYAWEFTTELQWGAFHDAPGAPMAGPAPLTIEQKVDALWSHHQELWT